MFWRLGFTSTSTLDTLLEKPNVTIEELLDEDDLLQECKGKNAKLVDFLSQPRSIKRLCEHVVGTAHVSGEGGREWEEKVRFKYPYVASEVLSSDIHSIAETALANSDTILEPFWNAVLHSRPGRVHAPLPHHSHPLLANDPTAIPQPPIGFHDYLSPQSQQPNLTSAFSNDSDVGSSSSPIPPSPMPSPSVESDSTTASSSEPQTTGPQVVKASDNGPGDSVLAGYWAKVNGVFLDKKPQEMFAYIRALPRIVERFVAHLETPAVVDLLYRILSSEQTHVLTGVVDWLAAEELVPQVVELLSPNHSLDLHNTVSEFIKSIIALSAPSPAGMGQGQDPYGFGSSGSLPGQEQSFAVQNKLVRELASEPMVRKMVSFMLDSAHSSQLTRRLSIAADEQQTDDGESDSVLSFGGAARRRKPSEAAKIGKFSLSTLNEDAVFDDDDDDDDDSGPQPLNPSMTPAYEVRLPSHRDSTSTVRPDNFFPDVKAPTVPVTPETSTSSLITGIGILIELIRKNNSDYFEQHLFHVMRTHLLQRQQEIAQKKMEDKAAEQSEQKEETHEGGDEDEEMEGMEEAMAELTDKMGIVHLGPMLRVLCERLQDFQQLIHKPQSSESEVVTTLGRVYALTFERYRITELYAELLHCSNMALLNRGPAEGPQYSNDGILQGGIAGLQVLARTLQGGDADETTGEISNPQDAQGTASADDGSSSAPVTSADSGNSGQGRPPAIRHRRQNSSLGDGDGDESIDSALGAAEAETAGGADPFGDDASIGKSPPIEAQRTPEEEEEDAKSIRSTLSSLSLADLVSPHPSGPPSPVSDTKEYVIGDLLKKRFLDCQVIPTILDLFFAYPWNNFLHNVVYDILQQCFNGRMDTGLNRKLTLAVFTQGHLPRKILDGHKRNDESMAGPRRIRLGFMGHANLIAEETVKLLERYPRDITEAVLSTASDAIPQPAWDTFVNESLKENREKESAPLAGGRPVTNAFGFGGSGGGGGGGEGDGDDGLGRSSFVGGSLGGGAGGDNNETFASYLSSQMNAAHSTSDDDDDSDEEAQWLASDRTVTASHGFEDVFDPSLGGGIAATTRNDEDDDDDDDDGWGAFASASAPPAGAGLGPTSSASSYDFASRPNLTPADWAASGFRQQDDSAGAATTTAAAAKDSSDPWGAAAAPSDLTSAQATPSANAKFEDDEVDEEEGLSESATTTVTLADEPSSPSSTVSDDATPFVDLSDAASYRAAQAAASGAGSAGRRLSASSSSERPFAPQPVVGGGGGGVADTDGGSGVASESSRRRSSSSASSSGADTATATGTGSTDPSAAHAADAKEPLGPGVSQDAEVKDGMITRALDDGTFVAAPLDDVALAQSQVAAEEQQEEGAEGVEGGGAAAQEEQVAAETGSSAGAGAGAGAGADAGAD